MSTISKYLIGLSVFTIFFLPSIFLFVFLIWLVILEEYEYALLISIVADILLLPHSELPFILQFQFLSVVLVAGVVWFLLVGVLFNKPKI